MATIMEQMANKALCELLRIEVLADLSSITAQTSLPT